jgi:nucleotide-binding universal stress UspA family protein
MQLRTILCAVDLSDLSQTALHYACNLARRYRSRLLVFHAVYSAQDQIYATTLFERGGAQTEMVRRARETIAALMRGFEFSWEPLVMSGEPIVTVASIAEEMDVDLVIAASRGLTGVKRILLGQILERLARTVPRPLLIVREHAKLSIDNLHTRTLSLKQILAGCSLKQDCVPVFRQAADLARDWNAILNVVHAMESPFDEKAAETVEGHYGDVQRDLEARLRDRLISFAPSDASGSVQLNAAVLPGLPGEVLLSWCRRTPTDLVVVGVRHHSRLEKVILGSTTESMLRLAPCPVLTVPTHV